MRVAFLVAVLLAACAYQRPARLAGDATSADDGAAGDAIAAPDALADAPVAGCGAPPACPAPSPGKQTICGQIYDLADDSPFADASANGAACGNATTGPCSLALSAYDAHQYALGPQSAQPLPVASTSLDDCGRFVVRDLTPPSNPYVAILLDDAAAADAGPAGTTNTVAIIVPSASAAADVEHWIVKPASTNAWRNTGGPAVGAGLYVPIFRTHVLGHGDPFATQVGVTFTMNGSPAAASYFATQETQRDTIDPAATATGVNGTALAIASPLGPNLMYTGTGGLVPGGACQWQSSTAATVANVVLVQIYRPISTSGQTCTQ